MSKRRIAVVGLGSMGAQVLWQLASRGIDAVGYEMYSPGHDRGAAGGETRIFRTAHFEDPRYVPLLRRADELWIELEAETGRELRSLTGCLLTGPPEHKQITTILKSVEQHGVDHELLSGDALVRRFPQFRFDEGDIGVFDKRAGFIRPELTNLMTVEAARVKGASVHSGTRVIDITTTSTGASVVTSEGKEDFDGVVVTTGAWINQLFPGLSAEITPRRLVSAWYVPKSKDLFVGCPAFIRTAPKHFYGVPSPDGISVKLGLSVKDHQVVESPDSADRTVDLAELGAFQEQLSRYLPDLYTEAIRTETYFEGYTEDSRPILSSIPGAEAITVLAGFSGHGFKLAPVYGEIGAQLALDGRTSLDIQFLERDISTAIR